jgi:hypothetical protein
MAVKARGVGVSEWQPIKIKHRTSIGNGPNSKPANKRKRRSWKRYRGQGR